MMKRVLRTLGVLGAAAVIAVALHLTVLSGTPAGEAVDGLASHAANAATNAALDASGVKDRIDQALRERSGAISSATGLPEDQVLSAIDELDISSWAVTGLPADASGTQSFSSSLEGVDATVTTYDDPAYVTVSADGHELTFSVPESARGYVRLLSQL